MSYFSEDYLKKTAGFARYTALSESLAKMASTAPEAREIAKALQFAEPIDKTFDIFLSHSYLDKQIIWALKAELERIGYSTYVDWIEDRGLDRKNVDKGTAALIRNRMKNCHLLFFATSQSSTSSKWMPWECGYFDGLKRKVAICPITKVATDGFNGTEFLTLYNTVQFDRDTDHNDEVWIHESESIFCSARAWINGKEPSKRI